MLCRLSDRCLDCCVDWCADRGRRAARRNGGLNRRKRCDDMWRFPQLFSVTDCLFCGLISSRYRTVGSFVCLYAIRD
jgi:hypothetical protein